MHRWVVGSILLVVGSAPSWAQEDDAVVEEIEAVVNADKEEIPDGWSATLKLGLSFNLNDARNVVGTDDGTTLAVGLVANAQAELRDGQHRWRNTLAITETFQRTPQLERFVKAFDLLDVTSLYVYKLKRPSWLGPYARATLQTPLLPGNAIRTTAAQTVDQDGNERVFDARQFIDLTSPFEPLQLRQSVGLFADPYTSTAFTFESQAGVAVQETFTQDGFVITGEEDGDVVVGQDAGGNDIVESGTIITIEQLENTYEFGGELEVKMYGEPVKDTLTYSVTGNLFIPAVTSRDTTDFDFSDRINTKVVASLGLKLTTWLSAEYNLNLIRQPQVVDEVQVQNGLVLAANFVLL
jgi:hypothetical protein